MWLFYLELRVESVSTNANYIIPTQEWLFYCHSDDK